MEEKGSMMERWQIEMCKRARERERERERKRVGLRRR
jgi:hypothetical protein